jgi:hypothetical protein
LRFAAARESIGHVRLTIAVLLTTLAAAMGASPARANFHACPNDAPFSIAIYHVGLNCDLALEIISTWNYHRNTCHTQVQCNFTYQHYTGHPSYHFECTNSHKVDHRGRQYIYMACVTGDRQRDLRSRYYPRGDWQPDP